MKMLKKRHLISYRQILVFMALLSFFRPTIFEKYELLNLVCNTLLIVFFVLIVIDFLSKGNTINDTFFYPTIVFFCVMIFATVKNHGDMGRCIQMVLVGICTVVVVFYIMKYELSYATKVMRALLWIFLLLNILSILVFPEGITQVGRSGSAVYFLGQGTRFAYFYLPALLFCYIGDVQSNGHISKNTLILYVLCCLSTLVLRAVGGSITLLALIPFFVFAKWKVFDTRLYFVIQLTSFFGLTYLSIQKYFARFLYEYLGKDVTMSSRTYIWSNTLRYVSEKPFFGNGVFANEAMVQSFSFTHLHNHLLQIVFQTGYVGFFVFMVMLCIAYRRVRKDGTMIAKTIGVFVFLTGIMLLVDTVDGIRNYYLFLLAVGAFVGKIKPKNDTMERLPVE